MNGALDIDGMLTGELSLNTGTLSGKLSPTSDVKGHLTIPPVGPPSYNDLPDKPSINTITVQGDKLSADYGLQDKMDEATVAEIESILYID